MIDQQQRRARGGPQLLEPSPLPNHVALSPAADWHTTARAAPSVLVAARTGRLVRLCQWVYFLSGLINAVVGVRFVLKILGASEQAAFTSFVYGASDPLVAPFAGIFPEYSSETGILEPHVLVAFVMYILLGWLLAQLVWVIGEH